VLIAAGIFLWSYLIYRPIEKVTGTDFSKVDMVTLGAGWNGQAIKLEDKNAIKECVDAFKDAKARKSFDQRKLTGIGLCVFLYQKGRNALVFDVSDGKVLMIDDTRYIAKNFDKKKVNKIWDKYSNEE